MQELPATTSVMTTQMSSVNSVSIELNIDPSKIQQEKDFSSVKTPNTPMGSNQLNLTFSDLSYHVPAGLLMKGISI